MARSLCFGALGWLAISGLAAAADRTLPPADKLEAAKRLVVDTFDKELSDADKIPAVKAMLEAAESTTNDPPAKAALYLTAAEAAARSGDTKIAFSAIEQLGTAFDCDVLALKSGLLETVAKAARTADARTSVANRSLELVDAAVSAGRFDVADAALKTAGVVSAKLRDADIRKELAVRRRNLEKAKRQHEQDEAATASALKKLEERPDDPGANEAYGKHLAFDRHDWAKALKHLAKAADADLQTLAVAERAGAETSAAMANLGDGWWALAERSDNPRDQGGYKSRAVFWYTRAVGGLSGFARTRLEKRIKDAGDEALAIAAQQTGGESDKYLDITAAPGAIIRLVKIPASKDGRIKEFYLGQTEVTQQQWQAVMGNNPSAVKGESLPVTGISLDEAKDFCERIAARASPRWSIRLPFPDERQHALDLAFAGVTVERLNDFAWLKDGSGNSPHPVATKASDLLGIRDMIGNVYELCADEKKVYGGCYLDSQVDLERYWTDIAAGFSGSGIIGLRLSATSK